MWETGTGPEQTSGNASSKDTDCYNRAERFLPGISACKVQNRRWYAVQKWPDGTLQGQGWARSPEESSLDMVFGGRYLWAESPGTARL